MAENKTPAPKEIIIPYRNEATRMLLIEKLKDEDRVQRILAVRALLEAGDGRNAQALSDMARDSVEAVRKELAPRPATLGGAPTDAFKVRPMIPEDQITENHRDPRVRQQVRLKKLESDPSSNPDFSLLLDDPDDFVRRTLTEKILQTRGAGSLPIWQKLLGSEKTPLRIEAAYALGKLDSKSDESAMVALMGIEPERLRLAVIESLGAIGGDTTRAAIASALSSSTGKTQEALLRLASRIQARVALPKLRDLVTHSKTPMAARLLAVDALMAMMDLESKPILLKIINDYRSDPGSKLREQAARALGHMGAIEAIPSLKKLLIEMVIPIEGSSKTYDEIPTRLASLLALEQLKAFNEITLLPEHPATRDFPLVLRAELASSLTRITGKPYDYRRDILIPSHFMESLTPMEYPSDIAAMMARPSVFQASP